VISHEQERRKYQRMWTEVHGYRQNSPGQNLVPLFTAHSGAEPGDSVLDAGCGTGRAGDALAKAGFKVTLLDICPEAVESDLPFIETNLWALPTRLYQFDWIFCCDVLEHIPPEHIDKTLNNIAAMGTKGAFFQIALHTDGFGDMIGERLHLTVMPDVWWAKKLYERWHVNGIQFEPGPRMIAFLRTA